MEKTDEGLLGRTEMIAWFVIFIIISCSSPPSMSWINGVADRLGSDV